PLQGLYLALTPAALISEPGEVLEIRWQIADDSLQVGGLQESLPSIVLRKQVDSRDLADSNQLSLDYQPVSASQRCQLSVDGGPCLASFQPLGLVTIHH